MNSLLFPLSRYKISSFLLILLSALLIVGQIILTDADFIVLGSNWLMAGVLATGIWYLMGRFHLGEVSEGKAIAITWPLMSIAQNFAYLYFIPDYPFYLGQFYLLVLLFIIMLILSTWQELHSTPRNLCIGLLIGLIATSFPHAILWLLLVPLFTFHMRSASSRNVFSIFTGALLGIWIAYFLLFVLKTPEAADAMLLTFADIFDITDYLATINSFSLWQWLFLAILALMVIIYSFSAMLLGTGHSVRASSSIMLISTLSIAGVLFLCLDISSAALYISQLALFLCIQLSVHQANLRSSVYEWWIIFIIIFCIAISVLPIII